MKVVIVLGAGASHGSVDVIGGTPPLGAHLFEALEQKEGSKAASLSPELKAKFKTDFETGMRDFFEESEGNVMAFQRELAQYLASFTPGPLNVYRLLLDAFRNIDTTYCSLNYDLLLEICAHQMGMMPGYGPVFPDGIVKILKIHGSSNFWPEIPTQFKNVQLYGSKNADVVANVSVLNQNKTLLRCISDDSFAPSMSMYAKGKRVLISPSFIDDQLKAWNRAANEADFIFIVGVKVHLVDEHVWKVISSSEATVAYFGFESDKPAFMDWLNESGKKDAFFHQADFKSAIGILRKYIEKL